MIEKADTASTTLRAAQLHDLTRGKRRPFLPIRVPGKLGRVYRAGENLTQDGADVGKRTWEDFLTEQVAIRRKQ